MDSTLPMISPGEADRLRLFVAGVTDYAIYMLSPTGIVSSWNAGAQRFKGYAAEEIIGQHFSRFYTDEDNALGIPARNLRNAIETGRFEDEGWRVRKDGTRFWANVVIDAIYMPDGALAGFAKITRDITEKKKAADALHASEERFRLLVQGVTDYAIYMLSPDGTITNWNAGARRIKGYEQDEVVGTHYSRFYSEPDRSRGLPWNALATAEREGRFEGEGWRIRKDGTRFWAHVVIDPIRDESGTLIGFAKVTRDITERRETAEALERAREALFQSQKLEAIGKLTGGVAHDFNNLLNVIVSGLDVLALELSSPRALKVLESMQRAADRGSTLTRQLLAFARKQPLKLEAHNINSVIGSFEAVIRRAAGAAVNFELRLDPALQQAMIDATQFEAALLNLVVNARDATPEGGTIVLSTQAVQLGKTEVNNLAPGRYVSVMVKDSGAGMPPEVVSRAIEPFFTTKEIGKGTGMGLSQVYGFVQQAGGDLAIESIVGLGTSVMLYLPALDGASDQDSATKGLPEKALVVDDQPDVLEVAVELFRQLGYDVLSASNGRDALEIIRRTPDIDVVFSDVVMPAMTGVELARQVRAIAPQAKIVLASGYASNTFNQKEPGTDGFEIVTKPYRMAEIIRKLRAAG
ncbi:hybrid sensor histidine kinase/response regulator [Noviherbaspirillum denitrificans]|uniref:histidine kinase n=2 Tax=Noviherbaspirillum denitrificans TaxID=1968433 RepID=A0A254TJS3_9BURK|nr:hybrid sensor histidine kinase/response regulator [Noviherbaspirillum denitrificans]